jgi:hypothetical protein
LQILKDADGAVLFFGRTAQAFDVAGVIFVRAVGKIQAANVHAQPKQVTHRGLRVASRADGADDLGAAGGGSAVKDGRCNGGLWAWSFTGEFWLAWFQCVLYLNFIFCWRTSIVIAGAVNSL